MFETKKITGKIVNHNTSIIGNLYFKNKIENIEAVSSHEYEFIIIPGFIDLHCHGGNGYDVMDGIQAVAGRFEDDTIAVHDTVGIKYTAGAITAAVQRTDINYDGSTADQEGMHMGVSFAVNDSLSVSAGRQKIEIDGAVEDEINQGLSASYTMGSITIGGAFNEVNSASGVADSDVEATILNLAFAF